MGAVREVGGAGVGGREQRERGGVGEWVGWVGSVGEVLLGKWVLLLLLHHKWWGGADRMRVGSRPRGGAAPAAA